MEEIKESKVKKNNLIKDLNMFKTDMSMMYQRINLILKKYKEYANPIKGLDGFFETGLISLQKSIEFIENSNYLHNNGIVFRSRGIGLDYCPGCIFCKNGSNKSRLMKNISGFVECKEDGEQIIKWVKDDKGIILDFRENEPDWIQVKIGSCDKHENKLKKLHQLCMVNNMISPEIIQLANNE